MADEIPNDDVNGDVNGDAQPNGENPPRPNFSRVPIPVLSDTQSVEYWFIRLESWFRLQNITDELTRFETVVASLTPPLFDQVADIIITPPATEQYAKLKAAIIEKFADSEYTRVDKLLSTVPLGAQRPSHLLADIRRTGATRDEKVLRVCWLRRLPIQIRAVISASKVPLTELAEMADAAYDTLQNENVSQLSSSLASSSTTPANTSTVAQSATSDIAKCIEKLTAEINELRRSRDSDRNSRRDNNRRRSSSRSNDTNNNQNATNSNQQRNSTPANCLPTCWYHRNFGTAARKCEKPCDFPTVPPAAPST